MPLIPEQILLDQAQMEFSEDAQYLLATKVQSEYFAGRFSEMTSGWQLDVDKVKGSFSDYKSDPTLLLFTLKPALRKFKKINWEKVVLNRQSKRGFNGEPIRFSELSNIVQLSMGLKSDGEWMKTPPSREFWPGRALPSGGGLYPLELYALALNVKGLPRGLYHFDLLRGGLAQLRSDKSVFDLDHFWAQRALFKQPAVLFFLTAVFRRSRIKYGPRSLRYILLEAGGIATHMGLTANAMGIDFCFDGGGFENRIEDILEIDGQTEALVSTFMVGHTGPP
jgi:SagB-type dehydrogenase family enzyme